MKKIPTLFERVYENHKIVDIKPNVTLGMEWVLRGEGTATIKFDGACCAFIDGEFYKRYDCKKRKETSKRIYPVLRTGRNYRSLAWMGKMRQKQSRR